MLVNWNIIIVVNNTYQLRVTKNKYIDIDYKIICNVVGFLIWAYIGGFESFLRRESWRKCHIVMQWYTTRIRLQVSFCILNI